MVEVVYYIENGDKLQKAIDDIIYSFPCFVDTEIVEMNFLKVTIKARQEDIARIEKKLAIFM